MCIDFEYVKRVGIGAACQGAAVLRSYFGKAFEVNRKGEKDLVTTADTTSEKAIIQAIRYRFPDHAIMAEESGRTDGSAAMQWIIDPLDGTTNFAHGLGVYAVSIAFACDNEVAVGVVLNPETGELFTAVRGKTAELNGQVIHVSETAAISDALLVTGFPYGCRQSLPSLMNRFGKCVEAAQGIRRLGSAALDLCYVACGRFDGFWEEQLKPWDTAAGMLIARQAGAEITDFSGLPYSIDKKEILATNGAIHESMLAILKG
ncbi:MAG: inositol monophosphatase family protein [Thermodesulfobacteriota bacterium]